MARYFGRLTTYTYSAKVGDPLTGLVARQSAPDVSITTAGQYRSPRSVAWQMEAYERAMFGVVPRGMESVADAYAAYAVGLRVAS